MNELIACIGPEGKAHVEKLTNSFEWDNTILIGFEKENISIKRKYHFIQADKTLTSEQLSEQLKRELKKSIRGTQVGINLFSGNGKLHMAAVSALLKLGLGIRLVVITPEGIKEI